MTPAPAPAPGSMARLGLLAGIWGASFLLIKVSLEGLSPAQVALGRVSVGAAVIVVVLAASRTPLPRRLALWGHLCVVAVLASAVPFFLFAWAEQRVTSSVAGVLNATTPILTALVAIVALPDERATPTRLAGIGLGFAGVAVILAPWEGGATGTLAGQLACLGAATCYGITFVYTRRFLSASGAPPVSLAAGQLLAASGMLWLLAPMAAWQPVDITGRVAAAVLLLGGLGTGVAYIIFYRLIETVGATSASMVTYLVPLVAVTLGVAVLDEPLSWTLFAGGAVVIAGIALAEGRISLRPTPGRHAGG